MSGITNRFAAAVFTALLGMFLLAACTTDSGLITEAPQATAEPTATPLPTAVPYEDFAVAVIPPADPVRLAQLTELLSLVPENYSSTIYLDMESLRSNDALAAHIDPEALGMDVALPSIATGLVNTIAVAVDFETRSIVTPFQADFAIGDLLQLAGGFGLDLGDGEPTPYNGHDVWDIDALGSVLSIASADETSGVAASGQNITTDGARALAEASLDAYDGRSAKMLDAPGLSELLGGVPSGFAAGVLSQCERAPLFRGVEIDGLSGCAAVVVSADVLPGDLAVLHSLISFTGPDLAEAAFATAAEALENQDRSHGFEDLGVRQEGQNLRVRLIVELSKFADAFALFNSGR